MSSTVDDNLSAHQASHVKAGRKERAKAKSVTEGGTYLLYETHNRGVEKSASEGCHPCEPTHLQSILCNLEEILEAYIVGADGVQSSSDSLEPQSNVLIQTLNETATEIDRLVQNPDLLPGDSVRERFYDELRTMAARFRKIFEILDNFNQGLETWKDACAETHEQECMPLRDRTLKPWQQFLSQDAPGCHLDPHSLVAPGSTQVIPMPGTQILIRMINKADAIFKDIESEHGAQANFENANTVIPTMVGADSWPVRGREIQSLEILAQDFVHLDGREDLGDAPQRRWNVVCLSVRDRPKPE